MWFIEGEYDTIFSLTEDAYFLLLLLPRITITLSILTLIKAFVIDIYTTFDHFGKPQTRHHIEN